MPQATSRQHFSPSSVLLTRVKLSAEEHSDSAQSYVDLGVTQHAFGNFSLAVFVSNSVFPACS